MACMYLVGHGLWCNSEPIFSVFKHYTYCSLHSRFDRVVMGNRALAFLVNFQKKNIIMPNWNLKPWIPEILKKSDGKVES